MNIINCKVSIIAPVYNVEKYIAKCIKSVIAQTYSNWEFILVNDCSPDNSQKIIDDYSKKDCRIKSFYTSENLCAGGARNLGLKNATGEYVMFIDSDDWIVENTLEECLKYFVDDEIDCVMFGQTKIYENNNESDTDFHFLPEGKHKLDNANIHLVARGPVGKIYKRKNIENIHFIEKVPFAEDVSFCLKYFWTELPTVYYIRKPFYKYIIHNKSSVASSSYNTHYFLVATNDGLEAILKNGNFEIIRVAFFKMLKNHFSSILLSANVIEQKKWCELARQIFEKIEITTEEKEFLGIYYDMSTTYDAEVKARIYKYERSLSRKIKDLIKDILQKLNLWKKLHHIYMCLFRKYKNAFES